MECAMATDSPFFRVDAFRSASGKIASSPCPPGRGAGIIRRFMTTLSSGTARPSLTRSLVGKKIVMAVTGGVPFVVVVAHPLRDLQGVPWAARFYGYAGG